MEGSLYEEDSIEEADRTLGKLTGGFRISLTDSTTQRLDRSLSFRGRPSTYFHLF